MTAQPPLIEAQVEAARAQLEAAVQRRQLHCVEEVLGQFPELNQHEEAVLELIYLEFVLEQEAGREPSPELYRDRFPHLAQRLTRLFDFEKLLDSGWQAPDTIADPADSSLVTPTSSGDLTSDHAIVTDSNVSGIWIGEYACVNVIGRGGMGLVYRGLHRTLKRPAAIKVVSLFDGFDEHSIARFLNEARLSSRVNHPHIVPIYESGMHAGIPYFAMEYMPGGSLQDTLYDGPLDALVAAQVVHTLARAVAYAHAQAIVHRDLKPGNILMTATTDDEGIRLRSDGPRVVLKISDFGLAKCLTEPGTQTKTGAPVGTPAYMAPEQIGSASSVDGRCDIYALGAMLYHLLVGKPPFQAATIIETWQMVQRELPLPVRTVRPSVPRDLETICLKCLEKEPERRYATADELSTDLQRFLDGRPIIARPVSLGEHSLRWAKRNPISAALVACVLITAISTTILWLRAEGFRHVAQQATQVSNEANQQTLDTLRRLTETVVLKKFAQQDQLCREDREYLEEIARLYERLAQLPHSDTTSVQIRGEGHYWSGVIYLRLADSPTAIKHFDAAISLLSSIESSAKSETVFNLINDSMELMSEALEIDNQLSSAILLTQHRIDRCQKPPQYVSDNLRKDSQRSVIAGYRQLGHYYDLAGDMEQALASWRQAHALLETALRAAPDDLKLLNAMSGTLRSMASVVTDPQGQLAMSSQALAMGRRLAEQTHNSPECLRSLSWALYDRAVLLKATGEFDEALKLVEEASDISQELVDQQPLLDEYRGPLAVVLGLRGQLLNRLERFREAQTYLERSIELLQRNLKTSPDAQMVHMQHARSWIELLKAHYGSEAGNTQIEHTREAAADALHDLRQVLQESGASLEKAEQLQRDLDAIE